MAGVLRRLSRSPLAMAGLFLVGFWAILALFAPFLPLPGPNIQHLDMLANPSPNAKHWLGVDARGRDLLARLIWGARKVLALAPLATFCAYCVGVPLGLCAGYFGGMVDALISRAGDIILSFPIIVLYVILITSIGPSALNIVLAVTIASAPGIARITRGLTLEQKPLDYIAAAKLRRESAVFILFVEILPNCRGPLITDFCLRIGYTIITIGILGFLGLGLPPPDPDWGTMVKEATPMMSIYPFMSVIPALAIVSLVLGFNLIADGLSDARGAE